NAQWSASRHKDARSLHCASTPGSEREKGLDEVVGATPPWRRLGLVGGRRATNGTEAARKRSILTLTDRIALPVRESREGCRRQELELRVSDRLLSLGGAGRRFLKPIGAKLRITARNLKKTRHTVDR